jgi:hypothetical protein
MQKKSMAIEPTLSLALALQSSPGAYAVLVGSGVSRGASIPTGWDIVTDMIRRIASAVDSNSAEEAGLDPVAWYTSKFGKPPSYSEVVNELAATPTERRAMLRKYFEPNDDERDQGLKLPTAAHKALARLVVGGYVRVIVTTNFDQLIENALREAGVVPAVIATPDAILGMVPLHLAPVTVVKVHGDYVDTRIKNTVDELSEYDEALDRLLDQVFDEYGLVICGWSATWDEALRSAITRAPNRRYSTFWAQMGEPTAEAQDLIENRRATLISIQSADSFFDELSETVASIESYGRRHPLTAAVAVESVKRYLPSPHDRIRLHDLVDDEVKRTVERTVSIISLAPSGQLRSDALTLLPKLEAASEVVMAMLSVGCYWGEASQSQTWTSAIERLGYAAAPSTGQSRTIYPEWEKLYKYPAQLAFYSAGLAALARGPAGEDTFLDILLLPQFRNDSRRDLVPAVYALNLSECVDFDLARMLPGKERAISPFSDYLFSIMRPRFADLVPDDERFADLFDRFEYFVALAYGDFRIRRKSAFFWAPVGRLAWRQEYTVGNQLRDRVTEEAKKEGTNWLFFRRGLFERSAEKFQDVKAQVDELLSQRGFG